MYDELITFNKFISRIYNDFCCYTRNKFIKCTTKFLVFEHLIGIDALSQAPTACVVYSEARPAQAGKVTAATPPACLRLQLQE